MKARFAIGDRVVSTVNAQGLKLGQQYDVAGVVTTPTMFGTFVTYFVTLPNDKSEIEVGNGHLVLSRVEVSS